MKNIFKSGILTLLFALFALSCEDDNPVLDSFFLTVRPTDGGASNALPGEAVAIEIELRSSNGVASLSQSGTSVPVTEGLSIEVVTYTFNVPTTATLGSSVDVPFTLTDASGQTASSTYVITIGANDASFSEIGVIDLGPGEGAAEISAYSVPDSLLFVVNNDDVVSNNRIDVVDFRDPTAPEVISALNLGSFGGGANSVAVYGGMLAVAVENDNPQADGVVLIYDISDLESAPTQITVGPLPDMLTFSPDGTYLVVANEGEPNDDYTVDPEGSISIIDVATETLSATATFGALAGEQTTLENGGLRIFGPGATFAQDLEPEYITISADSETAYVTLQENNGVAVVDLSAGTVSSIIPLGFKDYTAMGNEIDVTNEDEIYSAVDTLETTPLFGVYQPDAIASFVIGTTEYLITANEGDARDYDGYVGERRVADTTLNSAIFTAPNFQQDTVFGRLKIMIDLGDTDGDGDYDALYSYGARSFTIWNASTGEIVFDSGNDLDIQANAAGIYPDGRSDDKSVEPEGVVVGQVGTSTYAFIGLERADAVAVYDVTNPSAPTFLSMIQTGDAPEGLVFISADDSPTGQPLLVVSSEDDGTVRTYNVY